jgi:two-component system sensor kinase FixL
MAKAQSKVEADIGRTQQELFAELDQLRGQLSDAQSDMALYENILSASSVAIISVDEDERIIRFSEGAQSVFGYSAEEIVGQPIEMLLAEKDRQAHRENVNEFRSSENYPQIDEFKNSKNYAKTMLKRTDILALRKDGTQFPVRASIAMPESGGKITPTVFLRDVSEFRLVEATLQKSREELAHVNRTGMLGEISASIAHELNQPLAAILSNAQVLRKGVSSMSPEIVAETLEDVVSDTQRAGEVIKRLRNLLRPQEHKVEVFDINKVVTGVVELLHSESVLKHISINTELAPGSLNVTADRVHAQQVLINLLSNAFDAMAECELKQRQLKVCTTSSENGFAQVSVQDTGHGFEGKSSQQLFKPFYTTKEQGMGMGLAISRTILRALGGRLWAENNSGHGATFFFTLPTEATVTGIEAKNKPELDLLAPSKVQQPKQTTIFIVDDDDSFRTAISRQLNFAGYIIEAFSSAEEFLQRAPYEGIGCLIVDLHMPHATGLDLQAKLSSHDYTMPILFLTGAGDTVSGVEAMKAGALDFLTKPVDEQVLLTAIEHAIEVDRDAREKFAQYKEAEIIIAKLTDREVEVLNLVTKGLRNKQVGHALGITEKTVKAHRGHLMRKAGADSVADLILLADNAAKNIS